MNCPSCGGELNQRNRPALFFVGLLFLACAIGAAVTVNIFLLIAALLLAPTGCYLVVWATYAKGLWCRACKRFPIPAR